MLTIPSSCSKMQKSQMKIEADGKRIEVDQISLRPSSSIGFSLSELSFQS